MLTQEEKELMAARYGEATRSALKPLSILLATFLGDRDLMAFSYLYESVSAIMGYSLQIAQELQEQSSKHEGQTVQ